MKYSALLIILFLSVGEGISQSVKLANNQLNLNLLPSTLSFESKMDDNKSFTLSGGIGYALEYRYTSGPYGSSSSGEFLMSPVITSSIRSYYYRNNVKKKLNKNSGNYVALLGSYNFKPLGQETFTENYYRLYNSYTVGPVWGIQRNYKNSVHLGLSIGLGVAGGKYINTNATIIGSFELGFVIASK